MDAVIIYESLTGNTEQAARLIATELYRYGVDTRIYNIGAVDAEQVAKADLVLVGTWTDGIVIAGQRPGRKGKISKLLPDLSGKRCVTFCTFAVNPGKTTDKLGAVVEAHGGEVLGGYSMHRKHLSEQAADFVERTMAAVQEGAAA
ncbi:MAG: flavodoxin family protein [Acidimicrobiales bacterium]